MLHISKLCSVISCPAANAFHVYDTRTGSTNVVEISAADLKGDAISYSAKSSEDNISVVISNDTLTIAPALNWHGDAHVTAFAYGSHRWLRELVTLSVTALV